MNDSWKSASTDVPFAVPFVQRLRFTRDLFGSDRQILVDLLDAPDGQVARIQFWLDSNVAAVQPDLPDKIRSIAAGYPHRLTLVGPPRIVPGGETVKNDIHAIQPMLSEFHAAQLDRCSYVAVVGGGAVLDAVGFAAAISHRGLRLVRVPTTTLAQADSGVGVKNGVNLFGTKNWLGAFAVPWAVINDARMLETQPERDFLAGFSEAVKVALLNDPSLFEEICENSTRIRRRDMSVCLPIIRRSAELHLEHIAHGGDPFEMLQARPLDFGHWSAHKLEAMTGFALRHGEAVAIGIAIDAVYASLALGLDRKVVHRLLACLSRLGFVLGHPQLGDLPQLLSGLEEFRQHLGGRLTLTMLQAVGRPVDIHEINRDLMGEAVRQVRRCTRPAGRLQRTNPRGRAGTKAGSNGKHLSSTLDLGGSTCSGEEE
jgi:3-dehydroquinate synthase